MVFLLIYFLESATTLMYVLNKEHLHMTTFFAIITLYAQQRSKSNCVGCWYDLCSLVNNFLNDTIVAISHCETLVKKALYSVFTSCSCHWCYVHAQNHQTMSRGCPGLADFSRCPSLCLGHVVLSISEVDLQIGSEPYC